MKPFWILDGSTWLTTGFGFRIQRYKRNKEFYLAPIALLFALYGSAYAQQAKKIPTVGFLLEGFPSSVSDSIRIEAFRKGLREIGYTEGENISIKYRFAEGKRDRLTDLAAELVHLKVAVIVTYGTVGTLAVKRATTTIPVVMTSSSDPVARGLVASLARPGGNVTGLSTISPDLTGKRLELLKEVIPKLTHVAVLWDPSGGQALANFKDTEVAARALGVQVQSLEVTNPEDFERAFKAATEKRSQGLIMVQSALTTTHATRIVELAIKSRLPTMFAEGVYVESGGLMSYSPNHADPARRAAVYVDKILKGTKPADLPVEQPIKFELVINLKAAKQIGLTVPPNVLARADKVIR
jgi:putative tryptophan/tyrosine transport system substrate-binding protein